MFSDRDMKLAIVQLLPDTTCGSLLIGFANPRYQFRLFLVPGGTEEGDVILNCPVLGEEAHQYFVGSDEAGKEREFTSVTLVGHCVNLQYPTSQQLATIPLYPDKRLWRAKLIDGERTMERER
jgi:hypothetical protein